MAKSCFDGYLTEGGKNCPYWKDGTYGSIGCGTHFPIMRCPYFKAMYEAEEAKEHEEVK